MMAMTTKAPIQPRNLRVSGGRLASALLWSSRCMKVTANTGLMMKATISDESKVTISVIGR